MEGTKFSLSFSKIIEKKTLQPSALKPIRDTQMKSQQEIIESIEENVIKSNAPQEQELVIPLLQRDRDHLILAKAKQRKKQSEQELQNSTLNADPHRTLTLEEQAEQALLAEAADPNSQVQRVASEVSIPNHDEHKVSITLGSHPTLDDFEEMPVDDFGEAMLRGMGWKKGGGVGSKDVPIIEVSSKMLGSLAASRTQAAQLAQQGEEEHLTLKKGSYALVSTGRHRGNYGIVESVEEDHVLLRNAVGGTVVREVEANITLVTKQHYSDSSRFVNKEMFDKFREAQLNKKKSSNSAKNKYETESDGSDDSHDSKDNWSSKLDFEDEGEMKHKIPGGRRHHGESNPDQENISNKFNEKTSNSSSSKDRKENDHAKKQVSGVKELKIENSKASALKKDPSNTYEINSLDCNSDLKISEVRDKYKNLQEAARCHKAKKDRGWDYSDSIRLDRKEKDSSHRSQNPTNSCSKIRHSRSLSPEEGRHTNKKAYSESEKSRRNDKSEYHSRTRDRSRPSRQEAQSKEQYLLSKYGDASAQLDQDLASRATGSAPWVREGLTVRITSEKFKGGKYFKEKVVVESVVTAVQCECRTSQGRLLPHVPPDILETVIPKLPPRTVMVVKGRHAGVLGRVLEQHKSSQEASVQLLEDRSQILRLHYEQICQYGP